MKRIWIEMLAISLYDDVAWTPNQDRHGQDRHKPTWFEVGTATRAAMRRQAKFLLSEEIIT